MGKSVSGAVAPKERVPLRKRLVTCGGVLFCALVYLVMFLPIAVVGVNSFNASTSSPYLSWQGFSLRWYAELFENDTLLEAFGTTIVLALAATAVSTALGTLAAVGMHRYRFRGKGALNGLLLVPVVIPEIVIGISLLIVFSRAGISQGMLTLLIAHVTFCVPFVIFNVKARFDGYDVSLEEASVDLGASRLRTFFSITLPMLAPGITGGALLAFSLSIDDVIISYFVSGQTMTFPLLVFQSVRTGVSPDVNALSMLILLGTVAVVFVAQSGVVGRIVARVSARRAMREA